MNYDFNYSELLLDKRWKDLSKEIKNRDNNECVRCMSNNNLECHHIVYRLSLQPWEYNITDLITLCHKCHMEFHNKFKVRIYELDEDVILLRYVTNKRLIKRKKVLTPYERFINSPFVTDYLRQEIVKLKNDVYEKIFTIHQLTKK